MQQVPADIFDSPVFHRVCTIRLTIIASSLFVKMKAGYQLVSTNYPTSNYPFKKWLTHQLQVNWLLGEVNFFLPLQLS